MAAYAHESITVADTAIGCTTANLTKAVNLFGRELKRVLLTVETAQVRVCWDGTTPTTSVGHLLEAGDALELSFQEAPKFRAIRATASSATVKATYEV